MEMKKIFVLTLSVVLLAASCSDYLDINRDPNSPAKENMTASMIFPGAEMALATDYGNFFRITGGYFAQLYAHNFGTSNYVDYSQFSMSATRSSSAFTQISTKCLKNMNDIIEMAGETGDYGTVLAATVIRAFAYQVLVDTYGEIPYTEAGDLTITAPVYDEGSFIYTEILKELDAALANVTGSEAVCTNLLFPGEKAERWIEFANLLKLRIYTRMGDTQKAGEIIEKAKLPTSDIKYTCYTKDESGQANPFYQEEFATYFGSTQVNVVLNLALYNTMNSYNDGRLPAFFSKNTSAAYGAGVSGTNFSTSSTYKAAYFSRPNAKYNDPVYMISLAEQYFYIAEYYQKSSKADKAEEYYKKAIDASFASAGVTGSEAVYAAAAYPYNGMKNIGIQKWVALSGTNPFEAWCELRRIKYPEFGSVTGDQIYSVANDVYTPSLLEPATLYTPILYNTKLGTGKVLQRFPYPESSSTRNANAPANKGDATPVFWAK